MHSCSRRLVEELVVVSFALLRLHDEALLSGESAEHEAVSGHARLL